jgi:hypothetical protein
VSIFLDKGLGRRKAKDSRDYNYLLRSMVPLAEVKPKTKHWTLFHLPLDQGNTGTCVGHAWKHWMLTAPTIRTRADVEPRAFTIYRSACQYDPWPQNDDGDPEWGTSVRAGAKALQSRGFLDTYGWAFTVEDAIAWLVSSGPLVFGTNWTRDMFKPDAKGFVRYTGPVAGGHAYCAVGWSEQRGAMRFVNSWSSAWGQKGRFWMDGETVEQLLVDDGEACTAVELAATWST